MPQNKKDNQHRSNQNMAPNKGQGCQRIRLRRNISKQQVIQRNLSHMQQSAQKKKVAQDLYYSQQDSRSPLLRVNTVESKPPVHNRLGRNKPVTNVNNGLKIKTQENKIKLRKYSLQQDRFVRSNGTKRNDKIKRIQSAQNRILRIRQSNQNQGKQISHNYSTQKVRLRRMRQGPVNYTVQVLNNKTKLPAFKHSISNLLNPKLQEEIRLIQNKTVNHADIPSVPIHPQGTGFTGTTLHERFSQL
ncbi:hypothetical protein Trydic_g8344 [Trypoxylus dichotomus]